MSFEANLAIFVLSLSNTVVDISYLLIVLYALLIEYSRDADAI